MSSSGEVTVFKCRSCLSFLATLKSFQDHAHKCRNSAFNNSTCATVVEGVSEDEIKPTVFPAVRVIVERLTSAEVANYRSIQSVPVEVTSHRHQDEDDRNRKGGRRVRMLHGLDLDTVSWTRTPRRSSLNALKNMRGFVDEIVTKEEDSGDWNLDRKNSHEMTDEDDADVDDLGMGNTNNKPSRRNFNCTECPAIYRKEENLDRHFANVHSQGRIKSTFTCPICDRMYERPIQLQYHLQDHSDAAAVEDAFNLWDGWPPRSTYKGNLRFSCKYCLLTINSHSVFLSHMKYKHRDKGRFHTFRCKHCATAEFDSIDPLIDHIKSCHGQEYYGNPVKIEKYEYVNVDHRWKAGNKKLEERRRPRVKCDMCDKSFDIFYLRAHKVLKHGSAVDDVKPKSENARVTSGIWANPENVYQCLHKKCNARSKSQTLLKRHFILHLENNPFACKVPGCGVKCDAKCHLDRHMKLHTGESRVTCDECGLSFSRKDKLLTHYCDKYKAAEDLVRNQDGSFRSRFAHRRLQRLDQTKQSATETEVREATSGSSVRRYPEPQNRLDIDKIFLSDPAFIKTCEENPGFKELILSRCPRKRNLNASIDFPYKCPKCYQRFKRKRTLEKHMKNHDPLEEFICSDCGSKLCNRSSLQTHMLRVHQTKLLAAAPERKKLDNVNKSKSKPRKKKQARRKGKNKMKAKLMQHEDSEPVLASVIRAIKLEPNFNCKREIDLKNEPCEVKAEDWGM